MSETAVVTRVSGVLCNERREKGVPVKFSVNRGGIFVLVAGMSCLLAGRSARGVTRTYTIVQNNSTIAISGDVSGSTITSQGTNNFGQSSLVAQYSGSIITDRQSNTINTISFSGGSAIDAVVNGNWKPNAGGTTNSAAAADYGGKVSVSIADINMAGRNLVADLLTSGSPADITSGQFDLTTSDVNLTAGSVDYFGSLFGIPIGLNGTYDLAGQGGGLTGNASISTQSLGGGMLRETLTIPITRRAPACHRQWRND